MQAGRFHRLRHASGCRGLHPAHGIRVRWALEVRHYNVLWLLAQCRLKFLLLVQQKKTLIYCSLCVYTCVKKKIHSTQQGDYGDLRSAVGRRRCGASVGEPRWDGPKNAYSAGALGNANVEESNRKRVPFVENACCIFLPSVGVFIIHHQTVSRVVSLKSLFSSIYADLLRVPWLFSFFVFSFDGRDHCSRSFSCFCFCFVTAFRAFVSATISPNRRVTFVDGNRL